MLKKRVIYDTLFFVLIRLLAYKISSYYDSQKADILSYYEKFIKTRNLNELTHWDFLFYKINVLILFFWGNYIFNKRKVV